MQAKLWAPILCSLSLIVTGCAPDSSPSSHALNSMEENESHSIHENTDFFHRDSETNEIIPFQDLQNPDSMASRRYSYLTGSARKWNTVINWYYNPGGQPSFLNTSEVIDRLIASTRQWEAVSGVRFQYQGITSQAASLSTCNGSTVVGWGPLQDNTVGYTQACYSSNGFTEFDMILDNRAGGYISNPGAVQMVAVHEFGHALGMGHTDVRPAVMSPMLSSLPLVQDDINGVRSLYGSGSLPQPTPTPAPPPPAATPAPTPAPTPVPTSSWIRCASEGQVCNFSGTRKVRYGANGQYSIRVVTGTVNCNNATFGDPIYGVAKSCEYSSTVEGTQPVAPSWSGCAVENQYCSFSGTRKVRYGANGVFVEKTFTGGTNCSNAVFGDPIPGIVKRCELSSL